MNKRKVLEHISGMVDVRIRCGQKIKSFGANNQEIYITFEDSMNRSQDKLNKAIHDIAVGEKNTWKIYVAGSITDDPCYEEKFKSVEEILTSYGFVVINPVKNKGFEYKEYIDMGLNELSKCDAIYLMNGWNKSKGARLELHYALVTGMKIIPECDLIDYFDD